MEGPSRDELDSPLTEHNSFDNDPWILKLVEFTEKLLKQDRIRLIGVCFGHQIIGRAAGVKVGRSEGGWEVSVLPVELTQKGKEIFKQDTLVRVSSSLSKNCILSLTSEHPPNASGRGFRVPRRLRGAWRLSEVSCARHVQERETHLSPRASRISRGIRELSSHDAKQARHLQHGGGQGRIGSGGEPSRWCHGREGVS